jgi:glycosyltransferase involved in cell wall biosynthesis
MAKILQQLVRATEANGAILLRLTGAIECLVATVRLPIRLVRALLSWPRRLFHLLQGLKTQVSGVGTETRAASPDLSLAVDSPLGLRDLLIITPDILGRVRIGLAMRHWEMARALAARGLTVTLATHHPLPADLQPDGFALCRLTSDDEAIRCACRHRSVLLQGEATEFYPGLRQAKRPIVVDLAAPLHLENLERNQPDFEFSQAVIVNGLKCGDFFICGNERQRLYWLGMLTALGRLSKELRDEDPELRNLIDVVRFGIAEEPPVKKHTVLKGVMEGIGPDDFVMTWFGGIWDWLDPLPLIHAAGEAWRQDPRIKLFFLASRIPNGTLPAMASHARELAGELGLLSRCVFFNEHPVPYEERSDYLFETDIGVLCQTRNLETQVSARIRLLEYLWGEKPILMNAGDEWSERVRLEELGLVVEGKEVEPWKRAMLRLCQDSDLRARLSANIARVKPQLYWKHCVEPIYEFVLCQRSPVVPVWSVSRKAG